MKTGKIKNINRQHSALMALAEKSNYVLPSRLSKDESVEQFIGLSMAVFGNGGKGRRRIRERLVIWREYSERREIDIKF